MSSRVSSRVIQSAQSGDSSRKDSADPAEYVSKSWIPISASTLALIKDKFDSGRYQPASPDLLFDVKQDFGLFAWFLKNLPLKPEAETSDKLPTQIIELMDFEKCKELFMSTNAENFPRSLQKGLKVQSSTLKHAVISSVTAETIAENTDLDSELTHICAVVRQMGINLIAWNYPRIYSRALQNCANGGESLEAELTNFLGYNPTGLAAELCLRWDQSKRISSCILPAEVKKNLESSIAIETETTANSASEEEAREKIKYCLNMGDAMARLSDPEHYPDHSRQWQKTVEELQKTIGPDAIEKVQTKLSGFSSIYSATDFEFNIDLEPRNNLTQTGILRVTDRLVAANKWITKCSSSLQEKFRTVYSAVDKRKISTEAINLLISSLLPELGFVRGCVYRFDERKMTLTPLLRIGETELRSFSALDCSSAKHLKHPAVMSICYSTPIAQDDAFVNGHSVATIAGTFGDYRKKAVLYVELSPSLAASQDKRETLIHFQAVQKTLADCFNFE